MTTAVRDEAAKLHQACREIGFFTVKDFGASPAEIAAIFHLAHGFSALPTDEKMKIRTHTDYGCLTLLAQDAVGGLEVKPKGKDWTTVSYELDTFIVNIGDLMQQWSNNVFQSTPHRVVPPLGKHRYAIPFFLEPNSKTRIECFPSCVTPEHPCQYRPIFSDNWITSKFNQTYAYRAGKVV
ncbi:MAG: 2OG-Fe(II) oxygenase family protein [Halothiobacillus sp.]